MSAISLLLQRLAASEYSCGAYGANNYGSCSDTAQASNSGFLSDTGSQILFITTLAMLVLFVSLLARHIVKRRSAI